MTNITIEEERYIIINFEDGKILKYVSDLLPLKYTTDIDQGMLFCWNAAEGFINVYNTGKRPHHGIILHN